MSHNFETTADMAVVVISLDLVAARISRLELKKTRRGGGEQFCVRIKPIAGSVRGLLIRHIKDIHGRQRTPQAHQQR